ncbi:DUF362 domain-containing protein [Heliophilum fasciatum]|uniref:DUF362 domain-containing protein n=1 Tax=Heliophilum fasciatum TaxID=35700 RepID=UPI00104DFE50|nr:DUF362 domain-containing protein [Heliophilum fasciatum]MCW2277234.1 putative Fe-S center protein [Heliophilum fasciatum]
MASKVYFANFRARKPKHNKIEKIRRLFAMAGFDQMIGQDDLTAIKLHFGERGNDTHINPVLVRPVVEQIKARGGKPFLTDTNTLYSGSRHNSVDHLLTALEHGFGFEVTGAPMIIADGLRSDHVVEVPIGQKHFQSVKMARDIVTADSMIVLSHVKGHEMAGFGGAIKNLAMGCAPAAGKKAQHDAKFVVNPEPCTGCSTCIKVCPEQAITLTDKKAAIDPARCIGCGECMTVCPVKAIGMDWETELPPFLERMTEYAYGAIKGKEGKVGFINFLTNITPDCDCCSWSDAPIVPDIGFLASADPVAIDKASYDLVNQQAGLRHSLLQCNHDHGEDKFRGVWDYVDGTLQFRYGAQIGMGSLDYELIEI